MDGAIQLFDVLDDTRSVEDANVVIFDRLTLEWVDIANADVGQLLESEFAQVHAACPVLLFHARADRKWGTVLVTRFSRIVRVDVRMGIDPDDIQVLKLLK